MADQRHRKSVYRGANTVSGTKGTIGLPQGFKRVPYGISSQRADEVGQVFEVLANQGLQNIRRIVFFQDLEGSMKSDTLRAIRDLDLDVEVRAIPFDRLKYFPFQSGDVAIVETNSTDPEHLDSIRETLGKNRVAVFRGLFDGKFKADIEEIVRPVGRVNLPSRAFARIAPAPRFER